MSVTTLLLIIIILIFLGVIPAWPHSRQWGYGPSGGLGLMKFGWSTIVVIATVIFAYPIQIGKNKIKHS
jgi:hypothetical protein